MPVLLNRASDSVPLLFLTGGFFGFLMSFLREPKRVRRVFQRLPGMLATCLVIFLAVMHGGRAVGVRGHFVKLGSSLM